MRATLTRLKTTVKNVCFFFFFFKHHNNYLHTCIQIPKSSKEPAILADVERIISLTPKGLKTKAEETSLWLFAVLTGINKYKTKKTINILILLGSRALTCENILLKHIVRVMQLERDLLI
jgi:hypothetical protein